MFLVPFVKIRQIHRRNTSWPPSSEQCYYHSRSFIPGCLRQLLEFECEDEGSDGVAALILTLKPDEARSAEETTFSGKALGLR